MNFFGGDTFDFARLVFVETAINLPSPRQVYFLLVLLRDTGVKQVGQINTLMGLEFRRQRLGFLFQGISHRNSLPDSWCRRKRAYLRISAYSMLSTNACKLASMMLSCTPTVPHSSLPSVDSIKTRVRAPVPAVVLRMRTL